MVTSQIFMGKLKDYIIVNDYVELDIPQIVRYIPYKNIHLPTPKLSIFDLRIFGRGHSKIYL
jgi:hypothetical protein